MVKWLTAFSMEELTRSISAGKEEALKDIPILAQMNASEIDEVLAESLQKNRPVSIQLNQKDYLGRQTESIVGYCLWQDKRTYNCSPKVHNSASSLG